MRALWYSMGLFRITGNLVLKLVECKAPQLGLTSRDLCVQRCLKPQTRNSDGLMQKKRPQKLWFCYSPWAHSPATSHPSLPSWLSFALLLVYQMTRPGLYQVVAASCVLWVRSVNLVGKRRHSLPISSDMFVAAVSLGRMYAENREPWGIEVEVAGYSELVIINPSTWEVPCLSCLHLLLCGNCSCCHLPSPSNYLPPSLFQLLSYHLDCSFSPSFIAIVIRVSAWGQYPYFQPWPLSWVPVSHFQLGIFT